MTALYKSIHTYIYMYMFIPTGFLGPVAAMSKRNARSDLNADNWDQDEETEEVCAPL